MHQLKSFTVFLLTVLLATVTVNAQQNEQSEHLLDFEGIEATSVGVCVYDLRTDEVLLEYNSNQALTPASILKSVTTATALSKLGADFRFTTDVMLRGRKNHNVWVGDIVVVAHGDPTLESSQFKDNQGFCDAIVKALKDRCISKIDGRIIVEQDMLDAGPIAQWEIEDVGYTYGAGLFGLNFRDNVFTLYPVTKRSEPNVPDIEVKLVKSESNEVVRGINSNLITVYSTNIADRKQHVGTTMPDPAVVLKAELKTAFTENGITLTNRKNNSSSKSTESQLLRWSSPDAATIMRSLMIRSDNMFAEGMLRAIAPCQSRESAIKLEKKLWSDRGLESQFTRINDGSGLTRANRVSPRFMTGVLAYMAKSDMADTYVSFFPKVGMEGTVKTFLNKTSLKGAMALKTGSVSGVQCYAGYKLDESGKPTHTVVVMINGFFCQRSQVKGAVEQMLLTIDWK